MSIAPNMATFSHPSTLDADQYPQYMFSTSMFSTSAFEASSDDEQFTVLRHAQAAWTMLTETRDREEARWAFEQLWRFEGGVVAINSSSIGRIYEIDTKAGSFCLSVYVTQAVAVQNGRLDGVHGQFWSLDELKERGAPVKEATVHNRLELLEEISDEIYCEVTSTALDDVQILQYGRTLHVRVETTLDMHVFPFDAQAFQLQFRSGFFCVHDTAANKELNMSRGNDCLLEWSWLGPRWHFELHDGRKPVVTTSLWLARRYMHPVKNIMMTNGLIWGLSLTAFSSPPSEWGDRAGVLFTLLLTVVAFKLVISDGLPALSYNTFLDQYLAMGTVFIFVLIVACAIVPHMPPDSVLTIDRFVFIGACALMVLVQMYFTVLSFVYIRRARRCNDWKDRSGVHDFIFEARARAITCSSLRKTDTKVE